MVSMDTFLDSLLVSLSRNHQRPQGHVTSTGYTVCDPKPWDGQQDQSGNAPGVCGCCLYALVIHLSALAGDVGALCRATMALNDSQ